MPRIITTNPFNKATSPPHTPAFVSPDIPLSVVANSLQPPYVGEGVVMSTANIYIPDTSHPLGCITGPSYPDFAAHSAPPFNSVFVNNLPIHYSQTPLSCGVVAGVGLGEVYCYERVPDSTGLIILGGS